MAAKFYPPKPPTQVTPQKPPLPINLDEIARQPARAVESAFRTATSSPPPSPDISPAQDQQIATSKLADEQKLVQVRAQIQKIDAEIEEARGKRDQQPQATSRLSQDQPSPPPKEESALDNPPSPPKKHLFPGQIAAQKKGRSTGFLSAIQRKVTKSETRAKIAGA